MGRKTEPWETPQVEGNMKEEEEPEMMRKICRRECLVAIDADWLAYCKLNICWYTLRHVNNHTQHFNYSLNCSCRSNFGGRLPLAPCLHPWMAASLIFQQRPGSLRSLSNSLFRLVSWSVRSLLNHLSSNATNTIEMVSSLALDLHGSISATVPYNSMEHTAN